jgi:flagellar hook-basal body complex protein FliE
VTPIPPIGASSEWSVGALQDGPSGASGTAGAGGAGSGFAKLVGQLTEQQDGAAQAAQQLAAGTASDPSQAVLAVERARLSMQLAAQIRTKVVESVNDIFHTQV